MAKLKLTPEIIIKIEELTSRGLSNESIAAKIGICERTFYYWIERADKSKSGIYLQFLQAIKKGESELEETCINGILEQGKNGNWQALAWILERLKSKRYGKKETVQLEGGDKPVKVQNDTISEAILSDPLAISLAFQIRERLRMGKDQSLGTGGTGESEAMDPSTTP